MKGSLDHHETGGPLLAERLKGSTEITRGEGTLALGEALEIELHLAGAGVATAGIRREGKG